MNTPTTDRAALFTLFVQRVSDHRSRMMTAGTQQTTFLRNHFSDDMIDKLAVCAIGDLSSAQADGDEHNFTIVVPPVCYVVCALPVETHQAADWFEHRHGGYTKVLERCWNSEAYRTSNCQVLCHISFGVTQSGVWTNITIFPIRSREFSFQPIIATDLLSAAERRAIGIQ